MFGIDHDAMQLVCFKGDIPVLRHTSMQAWMDYNNSVINRPAKKFKNINFHVQMSGGTYWGV
jgi:hypothetical protein